MGFFVAAGVFLIRSNQLHLNVIKLISTAQVVKDLVQIELGFFLDVQARQENFNAISELSFGVDADLVGRWRAAAAATRYPDAVWTDIFNF